MAIFKHGKGGIGTGLCTLCLETLIGDINPPEELMKTLTDRKVAGQQQITYATQRDAQKVKQELEQATALAATQAQVVDAERKVAIADYNAQANVKTAGGSAEAKTINAKADAEVIKVTGEAEAGKTLAVGEAEATVIRLKIGSMDAGNYASVQIAEALARAGIPLVPEILVTGGNTDGKGGTLVDVLIANMVRDGMDKTSKEEKLAASTVKLPRGKPADTSQEV
jgi:uncharacterized membrane protein YqiK